MRTHKGTPFLLGMRSRPFCPCQSFFSAAPWPFPAPVTCSCVCVCRLWWWSPPPARARWQYRLAAQKTGTQRRNLVRFVLHDLLALLEHAYLLLEHGDGRIRAGVRLLCVCVCGVVCVCVCVCTLRLRLCICLCPVSPSLPPSPRPPSSLTCQRGASLLGLGACSLRQNCANEENSETNIYPRNTHLPPFDRDVYHCRRLLAQW